MNTAPRIARAAIEAPNGEFAGWLNVYAKDGKFYVMDGALYQHQLNEFGATDRYDFMACKQNATLAWGADETEARAAYAEAVTNWKAQGYRVRIAQRAAA